MAFKLGKGKRPAMYSGTIRSKMRFGQEAGGDASVPGTPVIRKSLGKGILGEANMDGSIYISDKITPGSEEEKKVVKKEKVQKYKNEKKCICKKIHPVSSRQFKTIAKRPKYSVLNTESLVATFDINIKNWDFYFNDFLEKFDY